MSVGAWVNPAHGTPQSRRRLLAAARAAEQSAFTHSKPRNPMARRPKVWEIGKADDWAYTIEPPPTPRTKVNYRSGTAGVGKNLARGAVAGVGGVKRVQPTRAAARRVPGAGIKMRDESKPPIDVSLIGKSASGVIGRCKTCAGDVFRHSSGDLRHTIKTRDAHRPRVLGELSHETKPARTGGYLGADNQMHYVGKVYTEHNGHEWRDDDGNWGRGPSPIPNASKRVRRFSIPRGGNQVGKSVGSRAKLFALRHPSAVGAIAGTALASPIAVHGYRSGKRQGKAGLPMKQRGLMTGGVWYGHGYASGQKQRESMTKRDRSYNPEHNRQRRLGVASAAMGAGGIALMARGGANWRKANRLGHEALDREAHRLNFLTHRDTGIAETVRGERGHKVGHVTRPLSADEKAALRNLKGHHAMTVKPDAKILRRIGGGAALTAAGGGTYGYSRSRANREYR